MKLNEIKWSEEPGTYAGVRFSEKTKNLITKFIQDHKISNGVKPDDLHTTLLYSKKHLPNYQPQGEIKPHWKGIPKCFDLFGDDSKTLVLIFDCPELYQRHHDLNLKHGATYDFPTYIPHVTFSYDFSGELDQLPEFQGEIEICFEYMETLKD